VLVLEVVGAPLVEVTVITTFDPPASELVIVMIDETGSEDTGSDVGSEDGIGSSNVLEDSTGSDGAGGSWDVADVGTSTELDSSGSAAVEDGSAGGTEEDAGGGSADVLSSSGGGSAVVDSGGAADELGAGREDSAGAEGTSEVGTEPVASDMTTGVLGSSSCLRLGGEDE
jgi:hypothetical protein